ncbi:MAG: glycosyltransferase [Fibrobacterota bacterium]
MSIALTIGCLYLLQCVFLARGLKKIRRGKTFQAPAHSPAISVDIIVAARNEEKNLPRLLESLKKQTFKNFTITVVNDRSTDKTGEIIDTYARDMKNLSRLDITSCPTSIPPKKNALAHAIQATKGSIILQTDADAEVPKRWIETMTAPFQDISTGLVQGITLYNFTQKTSFFLKTYQSIDFLSYDIIAAAAIGQNFPISANANNLAYRRSALDGLTEFSSTHRITSGDDDFLLQKMWESKRWDIHFCAAPSARVRTTPCYSWKALLNQRARWGSKTVYYSLPQRLYLIGIFLFYLTLAASFPLAFAGIVPAAAPVVLLGIKLLGEAVFMLPGARIFNIRIPFTGFIAASFLQLGIVLYSVIRGVFGRFSWKDQSLTRKT